MTLVLILLTALKGLGDSQESYFEYYFVPSTLPPQLFYTLCLFKPLDILSYSYMKSLLSVLKSKYKWSEKNFHYHTYPSVKVDCKLYLRYNQWLTISLRVLSHTVFSQIFEILTLLTTVPFLVSYIFFSIISVSMKICSNISH